MDSSLVNSRKASGIYRQIHIDTTYKKDEKMLDLRSSPKTKSVIIDLDDKQYEHWIEYKPQNKAISRRSYHSAVAYQNYLYVYGGYEMNHGIMSDCYKMNFEPEETDFVWIKLDFKKNWQTPGPLFRHSAIVHDHAMYIYGGQKTSTDNTDKFFKFDFITEEFTEIITKSSAIKPPSLDTHNANLWRQQDEKVMMIINCGFIGGHFNEYTNSVWGFEFSTSTWIELFSHNPEKGSNYPSGRMDQSTIINKNALYMFGGTDGETKFDEFWKFDLINREWSLINCQKNIPDPRNGHSMNILDGDCIILFGGIHDIAHEKNDIHIYLIEKNEWRLVEGEPSMHHSNNHYHKALTYVENKHRLSLSPKSKSIKINDTNPMSGEKKVIEPIAVQMTKSKGFHSRNISETIEDNNKDLSNLSRTSRSLAGKKLVYSNYPKFKPEISHSSFFQKSLNTTTLQNSGEKIEAEGNSPLSNNKQATTATLSPDQIRKAKIFQIEKKMLLSNFEVTEDQKLSLRNHSPTTEAMRSSIEGMQYMQQQKQQQQQTPGKKTDNMTDLRTEILLNNGLYNNLHHIAHGKKPCARNGHSATKINNKLIVFGGDRHKMCFSDLYGFDLDYVQKYFIN